MMVQESETDRFEIGQSLRIWIQIRKVMRMLYGPSGAPRFGFPEKNGWLSAFQK